LIRHWQRLKGWVDADRRFLAWQQRLRASVEQYEESKGRSDFILRGFPLTEALDWLKKKPDSFSSGERQFVIASKARKIRRNWATALVSILVLVVVGGPFAWLWEEKVTVKYAGSVVLARLHLVQLSEPEMEEIPEGTYQQGEDNASTDMSEKRLDKVTVKRFKIGKYEVTFQEYDRYVELTGGRSPNHETWGREKRPVMNVSWEDAKAYAKWLSQATGKHYRLPTESEWEYAARSGGKNIKWAGTLPEILDEKKLSDYAVYDASRTEPVGGKKPNGLGLYDMGGNVWEWVQDCYDKEDEDKCVRRVLRGGSWSYGPVFLRVSNRFRGDADFRSFNIGFRLAQNLP
jgi:formylglycine-generating enzyme required for sulfatase activity